MNCDPSNELPDSARAVLSGIELELYLSGSNIGERYAVDWSGEHPCKPPVVFRPRTVSDVSRILQCCHKAGQPLVIQGGLTGLSGGATPIKGEWSLSTERMNRIVELDPDSKTITVGAGTTLRVDAYHRKLTDLRPRYENLFENVELFPETTEDRVEVEPSLARLRGVEILLAVEGYLTIKDLGTDETFALARGGAVFVPNSVDCYELVGAGVVYRAGVPRR